MEESDDQIRCRCSFCDKKFPMENDCFIECEYLPDNDELQIPSSDDGEPDVGEEWKFSEIKSEDLTEKRIMCICQECRDEAET